jgi:Secretion system C-terminal sorting domain
MKKVLFFLLLFSAEQLLSQTCFTISNRTNGNGNPGTCGIPNCSGNTKTGHIEVNFGSSCPGVIPNLTLIAVTSGSLPNPFCFDAGNCITPGTVRYCFRGSNLPNSGSMTLRLVQGVTTWTCSYDVNGGGGTVLPLQLISFDAGLKEKRVSLTWRTMQEINTSLFFIERSSDGRSYSAIGTVTANGNSSSPRDYSYEDNDPVQGISYYRLKQKDIDGHISCSEIKRVDNRIEGVQLKTIFPNPVEQDINLRFRLNKSCSFHLTIISMTGKNILSAEKTLSAGEQNWLISLPPAAAGVYKLIITNTGGDVINERIMLLPRR